MLLLAATPTIGSAQTPEFEKGTVITDIEAGTDPSRTYALYLPTSYAPDRTSPVLFLMDPRGRALVPMELFRDAAERYGFLVLSSYNTLSDADSAFAVNRRSLSAMLVDARARFKVDPKRLYLVGFSGTEHYSWTVAPQLDGSLAGIMGVGGGLPAYSEPMQRALEAVYPFAFFGTAGFADFNFDGVRFLDQSLDATAFPHRFVTHDGDHVWPPKEIAEESVEWFHLRAMVSGLTPRDDAFIASVREKHLQEAESLEAAGKKADAYRRYREIVQDFEPLGGVPEAKKKLDRLADDGAVERELNRRSKLAEKVIEYKLEVRDFYLAYRERESLPSTADGLKKLRIDKLKKQAESDDTEESASAKRMLATAFINAAFYEPGRYIDARDFPRAAGMLRLAMEIQPDNPRACYMLARATAQLGEIDEAFRALQCGLKAEWATTDLVNRDPLLEPLRADGRFGALLAGRAVQ